MGLAERGEIGGSEEQGGAGGKEDPVEPKRWRAEMLEVLEVRYGTRYEGAPVEPE